MELTKDHVRWGITRWPRLLAIGMLAIAAVSRGEAPFGFYVLLTYACCAVFAHATVQSIGHGEEGWAWAFGTLTLLFNPLRPAPLGLEVWIAVDVVVGVVTLVSLFLVPAPVHGVRLPQSRDRERRSDSGGPIAGAGHAGKAASGSRGGRPGIDWRRSLRDLWIAWSILVVVTFVAYTAIVWREHQLAARSSYGADRRAGQAASVFQAERRERFQLRTHSRLLYAGCAALALVLLPWAAHAAVRWHQGGTHSVRDAPRRGSSRTVAQAAASPVTVDPGGTSTSDSRGEQPGSVSQGRGTTHTKRPRPPIRKTRWTVGILGTIALLALGNVPRLWGNILDRRIWSTHELLRQVGLNPAHSAQAIARLDAELVCHVLGAAVVVGYLLALLFRSRGWALTLLVLAATYFLAVRMGDALTLTREESIRGLTAGAWAGKIVANLFPYAVEMLVVAQGWVGLRPRPSRDKERLPESFASATNAAAMATAMSRTTECARGEPPPPDRLAPLEIDDALLREAGDLRMHTPMRPDWEQKMVELRGEGIRPYLKPIHSFLMRNNKRNLIAAAADQPFAGGEVQLLVAGLDRQRGALEGEERTAEMCDQFTVEGAHAGVARCEGRAESVARERESDEC